MLVVGSEAAPFQAPSRQPPGSQASRPNIVLYLSDDHSRADAGCYGSDQFETPRIDRLAKEGLVFDEAATVSAICVPSRASLFTGLYPERHGAAENHSAVSPGTRSLPHVLGELGYRVVLAGKRHVQPESAFPFDHVPFQDASTEAIEAYLDQADDRPVCLVIGAHRPHEPHEQVRAEHPAYVDPADIRVPPRLIDTPPLREELAAYAADVWLMDQELGVVLDMLERRGLASSTLMIYTSDHGHGLMGKFSCYDAGLAVPLVVRWPGVIPPGLRTDALVSVIDWLPTLVEIAGGEPIEDLDGRSLLPLLRGETAEHRDVLFATHTNLGIAGARGYPIRAAWDHDAKFIWNLSPDVPFTNLKILGKSGREETRPHTIWGSWRQAAASDPAVASRLQQFLYRDEEELYDRRSDPHELTNVARDPTRSDQLSRLRERLYRWIDDGSRENWPPGEGDPKTR
jgi:uncharacterized sulfatase